MILDTELDGSVFNDNYFSLITSSSNNDGDVNICMHD